VDHPSHHCVPIERGRSRRADPTHDSIRSDPVPALAWMETWK
jgi:hypothetical protein